MNNEYPLINDVDAKKYEFHIKDYRPRIEYIIAKERIFLTHTEVLKELEGKGIASALIKASLQDIETKRLV